MVKENMDLHIQEILAHTSGQTILIKIHTKRSHNCFSSACNNKPPLKTAFKLALPQLPDTALSYQLENYVMEDVKEYSTNKESTHKKGGNQYLESMEKKSVWNLAFPH